MAESLNSYGIASFSNVNELNENKASKGNFDLLRASLGNSMMPLMTQNSIGLRSEAIVGLAASHESITGSWFQNMKIGTMILKDQFIPDIDFIRVVIHHLKRGHVHGLLNYSSLLINVKSMSNGQIFKSIYYDFKNIYGPDFQIYLLEAMWHAGLQYLTEQILFYFTRYPNQLKDKKYYNESMASTHGFSAQLFTMLIREIPFGYRPVFYPPMDVNQLITFSSFLTLDENEQCPNEYVNTDSVIQKMRKIEKESKDSNVHSDSKEDTWNDNLCADTSVSVPVPEIGTETIPQETPDTLDSLNETDTPELLDTPEALTEETPIDQNTEERKKLLTILSSIRDNAVDYLESTDPKINKLKLFFELKKIVMTPNLAGFKSLLHYLGIMYLIDHNDVKRCTESRTLLIVLLLKQTTDHVSLIKSFIRALKKKTKNIPLSTKLEEAFGIKE